MKSRGLVFLLLIFVLGSAQAWAQTPTPTSLPGCCLQASGWADPSLGTGSGLAVDKTLQRVYATDQLNGLIRAFHYDGTVDTTFGGGSGQVAVSMVFGVAVGLCDHPGVYGVTRSYSPSVVTKFDTDGNLVWSSPPLPDGAAFNVNADDNGNSYVSDGNSVIYVLDPAGNLKATITGSGSWALTTPVGVFAQGQDVYVADTGNDRFVHFVETALNSYSYTPVMAVTVSPLSPYEMTRDLAGHFYVSFQNSNGYQVYDDQFNPITPLCSPGSGYLLAAFGISLDESGAIYIADNSGAPIVAKMQACFAQPAFYNCYKGADPPQQDDCFVYPSPAKGDHATVSYVMTSSGRMDLKIFNENGELAADITDHKNSGVQITPFGISRLAAGVYYYVVTLSYDNGQVARLKTHKFAVTR